MSLVLADMPVTRLTLEFFCCTAFEDVEAVATQLFVRHQDRIARQAARPTSTSNDSSEEEGSGKTSKGGKGKKKAGRGKKGAVGSPDGDDDGGEGGKKSRKVPHNAIERRYRNNINDRIAALRNAVPALRNLRPKSNGGSSFVKPTSATGAAAGKKGKAQDDELVDGVSAATKLNKATILGKATEYILYLKSREVTLMAENEGMKELVRSLKGGDDLLAIWMTEMEETKKERERESQSASGSSADDNVKDEMRDEDAEMHQFTFDYDDFDAGEEADEDGADEDSPMSGSPASGSGTSAGNYMLAAFMGFTILGGSTDLAASQHMTESSSVGQHVQTAAREAGSRVLGASHQLLKRTNIVTIPQQQHHLDNVASHLLLFEIMRFVSLVICALLLLVPIYRFIRGGSSHGQASQEARERAEAKEREEVERRKSMLSMLGAPRITPRAVDRVLRKYTRAPTSELGAAMGIVKEVALSTVPRTVTRFLGWRSAGGDRGDARVWLRLLEVETAWGPFAEPSLLKKVHTIVKMRNMRVCQLDQTCSAARIHATLALALGRLGATDNAIGRMMRASAIGRWRLAHQAQLVRAEEDSLLPPSDTDSSQQWLTEALDVSFETALAACPSEAVASGAALAADPEMRTFLATPLLLVANGLQVASLREVWSRLFPSIVHCAAPNVLASRDEDSMTHPTAFLREFAARRQSSAGLQLAITEDANEKAQLTERLSYIMLASPQGTPSHVLARVTLGAWAFMLGNRSLATQLAYALAADLQRGVPLLGAQVPAESLVRLILGDVRLPTSFSEPASTPLPIGLGVSRDVPPPLATDEFTFSLVASSLNWLRFLRLLAASTSSASNTQTPVVSTAELLQEALALRRLLARAVVPLSRRASATAHGTAGTALPGSAVSRPSTPVPSVAPSSDEVLVQESKEDLIDVLSCLCHYLGRKGRGKDTRPLFNDDGFSSDSGVDFV